MNLIRAKVGTVLKKERKVKKYPAYVSVVFLYVNLKIPSCNETCDSNVLSNFFFVIVYFIK